MKSTLLIAYNGGSYGTYLEWVLATLLNDHEIKSPFTGIGTSHNSKLGHHLGNQQGFLDYIDSTKDFRTARLHPKTLEHESLQANLAFYADHTHRVILLYPDRNHELMCVCNYMTKVWEGDPYDGPMAYVNPEDLYRGYDLEPGTDIRTIPVWMRREHISFSLFTSWHAQVEWYLPDQWHDPRVMIVTTRELFEQFEHVMMRIRDYWGVDFERKLDDLWPFHREMIKLQTNYGKDQLCNRILLSVLTDHDHFDFGDICLVSEAWIQYQLRLAGYQMQCHDLNVFPHDTKSLRSIIDKF